MKNIAIISTSYPPNIWNGQGRSTHSIAYGLAKQGHSVTVYTFTTKKKSFTHQDGQVLVKYIGDIPTDASSSLPFAQVARWNELVLVEMLKAKHCTIILGNPQGWDAAKAYKDAREDIKICGVVPLLYTFTGWLQTLPENIEQQARLREADFLIGCDVLITHTKAFGNKLADYTNRPVFIVPNFYLSLSKIGIPDVERKKNQICFIGKMNREKSIERIIRVLPVLKDAHLVIASPESSRNYFAVLLRLAKELDVEHRLEFVGWKSTKDTRELYCQSSLAIVPSQVEPYGYSALDPMSLNIPLLVSEWSFLGEYIAPDLKEVSVFNSLDSLAMRASDLLSMSDVARKEHTAINRFRLENDLNEETATSSLEYILCQL